LYALEDAGITPQDYIEIKEKFGKKTRLGEGEGTCFGSLVWCCKPSKPCPLRDMVMRRIDMSTDEFLELKKQLSEELVGKSDFLDEGGVKALADTFNVSEEEALKVLQECNNDIRTAMKVLRMKDKE
jgi:putative methanogenesis marker domain 9